MAGVVNFTFSIVLKGYMLSSSTPSINVSTAASCGMRCTTDSSCVAFFHNKKTGYCAQRQNENITSEKLISDRHMRYYVLHTESCPSYIGYRMAKDYPICYKFHVDQVVHASAVETCNNEGGFLLRIDSKEKHEIVHRIHEEVSDCGHTWVDGTDEVVEDEWRYDDGTLMTYAEWANVKNQQPNHDGDCLRIGQQTLFFDTSCWNKNMFICEITTT